MNNRTIFAVIAALTLSFTSHAHAWSALFCPSGYPLGALQQQRLFHVAGCPSVATAAFVSAVEDSAFRWNDPTGMYDRFALQTDSQPCGYPITQPPYAGEWTIAESHESEDHWPLEPDDLGVAWFLYRLCDYTPSPGEIYGARIISRNTVTKSKQNELSTALSARDVMNHEFGHLLGLSHDYQSAGVMGGGDRPRVGRTNGISETQYISETPFATEYAYAFQYQSNGNSGLPDIAMSAWHFDVDNGETVRHYGSSLTVSVCPGDIQTVRYTVANLGKVNATNFYSSIMMSSDAIITNTDTFLNWYTLSVQSAWYTTYLHTFTVPSTITSTPVYIGVILDRVILGGASNFSEDNENNNAGRTGLLIKRKSTC